MSRRRGALLFCLAIALAALGFFAWSRRGTAPTVGPSPAPTSAPAPVAKVQQPYAPTTWKVWKDGSYDRTRDVTIGYQVGYPRDFDVYRGDQASGGYLNAPRVKISFPQDAFLTPKTNYGEAFMTVSVSSTPSAVKDCYKNPIPAPGSDPTLSTDAKVNGIDFKTGHLVDVGAGQIYDTDLYRTMHEGSCYEVALTVHTGNIHNYPDGTVTEFDKSRATSILDKMLGTFTFTEVQGVP